MNLDDLKKQAQNPDETKATTWKATEVGDELAGTITKISYVGTRHGETYMLTVTDEKDEAWTLWVSGTVLKTKLIDLAPPVGALIVVVYSGKQTGKNGYDYNDYQVQTSEQGAFDQWSDARRSFMMRKELADTPTSAPTASQQPDLPAPF